MLRILHYCACNRDHARKPHLLAAATNEVYTQVTGRGHKRETFTRLSLGIFRLGTFALNLSLAMLVWRLSPSIPRLETFPWDLSTLRLKTFEWYLSLAIFRLGVFAWHLSCGTPSHENFQLGIVRLDHFIWDLSLESFRLGSAVWDPLLGSLSLETLACELRIGELALDVGGIVWRILVEHKAIPGFLICGIRSLLGKPSRGENRTPRK